MDLTTGLLIGIALMVLLWVPFLVLESRRGKALGHTGFTVWKPRGHSDIGGDTGPRPTQPGKDDARGLRF